MYCLISDSQNDRYKPITTVLMPTTCWLDELEHFCFGWCVDRKLWRRQIKLLPPHSWTHIFEWSAPLISVSVRMRSVGGGRLLYLSLWRHLLQGGGKWHHCLQLLGVGFGRDFLLLVRVLQAVLGEMGHLREEEESVTLENHQRQRDVWPGCWMKKHSFNGVLVAMASTWSRFSTGVFGRFNTWLQQVFTLN